MDAVKSKTISNPSRLGAKEKIISRIQEGKIPDPILIDHYLKQDSWTAKEAMLLLAGYSSNQTEFCWPVPNYITYLDCCSAHDLSKSELTHPLAGECLGIFNSLCSYCRNLDEVKTPQQWRDWAKSKGITPYWSKYADSLFSKIHSAAGSSSDEPSTDIPAGKDERVLSVTKQQDKLILNWLKENNYDPLKLPKPPRGKAGVKKACSDKLCTTYQLTRSAFLRTWDRLRSDKKIIDA